MAHRHKQQALLLMSYVEIQIFRTSVSLSHFATDSHSVRFGIEPNC